MEAALSVLVHTCVTGGYDEPRSQPEIDGVTWIFHTDDPNVVAPAPWRTLLLDPAVAPAHHHPRRRAKYPKAVPFEFPELCGYDYTLWMDGNLQIQRIDVIDIIRDSTVNGFSFSPHFNRRCIYNEAMASIRMGKYRGEPVAEQVIHYQRQGMPANWGLIETSMIGRDLGIPLVREVGKRWLEENLAWSYQDQVSLPYVLWTLRAETGRMPKPWRVAGWASYAGHPDL